MVISDGFSQDKSFGKFEFWRLTISLLKLLEQSPSLITTSTVRTKLPLKFHLNSWNPS